MLLSIIFGAADAGIVKKSSSGICHSPGSAYYERTENFQPFNSVLACLGGGGRLPRSLNGQQASISSIAKSTAYSRSRFGHGWDDSDGDCPDSRAEALNATSSTPVRFDSSRRCQVVSGRWVSPFTGSVIQNSDEIDIDHVVPLKWAWERGAKGWTQADRERFSNDVVNLWPVELSLNRSKGARGPDEWLPPSGQCGYVARFVRIVKQYDLTPTKPEARWLDAFLERCRS